MTNNTVINKSFSPRNRKRKNKQTEFDSTGTVYRPESHGLGIWGNPRVPMTIRVDEKLKKEGKRVLIDYFGSTCRGIESYLAGLVATYNSEQKHSVYRKPTVNIGKLIIERNLRSRRKLEEEVEVNEKVTVTVTCGHVDCHGEAIGSGVWKGKIELPLCADHYNEAEKSYGNSWSELKLLEVAE